MNLLKLAQPRHCRPSSLPTKLIVRDCRRPTVAYGLTITAMAHQELGYADCRVLHAVFPSAILLVFTTYSLLT